MLRGLEHQTRARTVRSKVHSMHHRTTAVTSDQWEASAAGRQCDGEHLILMAQISQHCKRVYVGKELGLSMSRLYAAHDVLRFDRSVTNE
jgi:hypothetical protein